MKKTLSLLILLLPLFVASQNQLTDELRYSKERKCVYQGTRKMTMDDLFVRMRPYPKSFEFLESARDCNFYATIFATAGAIPLGYVVVTKLLSNEVSWPVLATGVGLVGVAIPLNIRYKKQLQRSVHSFNEEVLNTSQMDSKVKMNLSVNSNGIGLRINF